jgi:two-component system chemotaxis response regulator CheB
VVRREGLNYQGSSVPKRDIIVIGASAGGVEALRALIGGLPADLAAAIFVVQHVAPRSTSMLPGILAGAGVLPAALAKDAASRSRAAASTSPLRITTCS